MKILATFFILQAFLNPALGLAESNTSLAQVIAGAQSKNIAQTRAWIKLLHIERNWLGFKGTQVTDRDFFFSENKSDSQDEMNKTLAAFLLPAENFYKEVLNNKKEKVADHSEHPICKYPARLRYLKKELSEFTDYWNTLPAVNCTFQQIFLRSADAKSVSFVFSSYYSDSPGSAFGHTFFRINRKANVDRQELLDYGVGYAAQVSVSNPILYSLFGLVGGFNGIWTNLPYYYKVREYNDFEARDLWSYDLNLTEEEVLMFTLHLWEVGSHSYTYYFFTQNCAFHMLTLLEAAAPRLHLIDNVPFYYVIPADSMKSLFYENNLVSNVSYRPSLRRVFQERFKNLDSKSKDDVKKFASSYEISKDKGLRSDAEYSTYLDAILDLISLRFPDLTSEKNEKMFAVKEEILKTRAEINHISKPIELPIKESERPDFSHGSSRVSASYSALDDNLGLSYRFALHDLLDNSVGMPENSQLEFFNFSFKKHKDSVFLDNFNLFRVLNLNPLNFYEKKLSWGLKLGSRRMDIAPGKIDSFYSTGVETQFGYSFTLDRSERPWTLWTMARADLGYAQKSKNNELGYGAIGYQVGLLKRFNNKHALLLTFEKLHPHKLPSYEKAEFEFRSSFTKNLSLGLGLSEKHFRVEAYFYY